MREERKEIELINEQNKLNVIVPIKSKEEKTEYFKNWYENNKQHCHVQNEIYRDNNKENKQNKNKEYYKTIKKQLKTMLKNIQLSIKK